ncbi:uncharacterized protein LOC107365449 isoform X4 [Tetranychus urticae]|uniref:uncharacterized protein LOC107365449 isoform X4 n=1 Tax=Tetranychus urticae TaxID=32264 RepID=UPI000D6495BF|nr:uncharacterized protein LOC107365449 isoform X4 [Tetranychus urticae]
MVKSSPQLVNEGSSSFLRAARAGNLEKVVEYLNGSLDINTANMNGMNALHLASKEGHTDMVKELLKRGANVNAGTNKGNTALHIASLGGKLQVVEILVDNGANVNSKSLNGFTPLYMAAQENHDAVVRYLLAHGANQSISTEDGFTPLAVALQQGHDKVVSILLENDSKGKVRLPALHIAAKKDDCKAAALLLQSDQKPDVTSKSGFTPLHIAAHYGNESIATLLLDKGANINFTAKHKITPLHVAAKWGKGNMVGLLLDRGAQIDAATRDGLTPLHCAARSGHEPVVDLLLRRGAPYSAKTKNGLAPLHMASQGDHIDSARTLLAYKAPVDDVTVDYLTPLHVAAHCGHVKVAKLLLDHKADVNAQALNGFVPLHIACKKNRLKVVELLLKHGASIEVKTESGLTPLHVASFMGCTNIVLFLIQHGANVNKSTIRGETPIHLAARAGQAEIIPILVRNGAQVDARAREDQTALHIASRLGDVEIVQLLLSRGASIDAATKDQYTALHIAAKEGKENVADALLEQGASLTATTKKGFTPLHLAAKYGQFKVARLLLEKDAPVDAQGKNGVTPLHVAAHYDHVQVALLLLEKKASPHATAKNGYTPLHIAAKKKQMEIATTLLEYGAKSNAESKAGFTPLHLAAQEGHTDMGELLISHKANVNAKSKLELTPLHLSAQSDKVGVAQVLLRNRADVNAQTKQGYTPLHVACHNGAINMIKLLIQAGANVDITTQHGYTPLHQAAQQGHTLVINLLLDSKASPNKTTNLGYTPLAIAQKCNYISVVETLKTVTEVTTTSIITTTTGEKYSYNNPETMQETFMTTDSEDEGGEGADNWAKVNLNYEKNDGTEYNKHDESFGFDVTHDESGSRAGDLSSHAPLTVDESISPSHIIMQESIINNFTPDNIDISRPPTSVGFLVSFMVDARGGAMRGCRHSGVRIIIPPRKAPMPMRITCRYLKKEKLIHPPPLMEGEACASRILEVGPSGAKFLGPVIIEVPHFASMRGREREIIILRSDDGENWKEHTLEASEEAVRDILNESFQGDSDLNALEPEFSSDRITRILTTDFPQYFAIITRIRQEVNAMGPEGGMVNSSVVPQVQAIFPAGALTKKIKVGLQAQPIASELVAKMLGNRVAVSPIVTVEPRRRKFHKPITLTIPVPQAATRGMINSYTGDTPTLRLLCSITGSTKSGGTSKAQWEDVTGSTPLSFVNNCVSFTTTVSARFWLMDCRQVNEATKYATDLYREATAVPFMSKFVVFAKRHDPAEAQMRIFCMTDDKEDKTLEHQEQFTETAKSRDVEVLEGKPQYLEFAGNLVPVTKSGEQLNLTFNAFRENRLPFLIRVRDSSQEPFGKIAFMKEPRKTRGEPPQVPICNLNIKLPDTIVEEEPLNNHNDVQIIRETIQRSAIDDDIILNADPSIMQMGQDLAKDWIKVASHLDLDPGDTEKIKKQFANQESEQATAMLYSINLKKSLFNNKDLCKALWDIGRKDLVTKYYPNHSQYLAEYGIKLNGKLDEANEIIKSSKGLPTEREVAFDDKDIMKDAESMEESEGESVGVNVPTAAANNKVSLQEARGQEDEERETAVKQYLKYLEDEDREDSEERAAYRGEKSTPNELYIIKEEIQVPTGDPVIDTTDGDKSSIPEPTYEAESQIKTEEKVEFTDEGGLTHSITQVTKTTIIQEVEDQIQASVQQRLQQQQPQSQQQQQLLESGKPLESETWQSGEQDTSQVSVSSLPEDEKSEPTTATVSSATTTTTNASENAVSSRIASVTEEPGTKITVEQNGNSDKEEYQLIAESILRQVYDEVFELIRTKKITIDDKEWFETEASGDVVHIIEQSTTCERNEDKSVKEENDHEMSYTEKKDYFAKLSHDSTVKPVPSTPHYYRSSSIETSGMNKGERRPSEGEIVETVGGFQERRAYFESTGRRSFSIDTASMDEARTAYNTCLVQRSSQHADSGLKEEDEQVDDINGNLNLLHDYGGNLGCNVSHVDVDEFNERASNSHYMSKDELYQALNQLEAEIELAQSDLDKVDKENEESMSQTRLESNANEPKSFEMNDKLDVSASTLHQVSTEEPSSLDNDEVRENRSSSALGSSSMRLIVRNRTDVSVKDFPANEVDVETGEIARLLVRPISRSTVQTTDPETSTNESVVYKVWKGLDPVERCPSPLRQQFSRALRDTERDPDDCVSGKSSNPDKDDKVTTLNQQIAIVQPIYLSNWKSMKNILTDEGLDLIGQAIEIALIQIPSEQGYPKYYYIGRELIKSLVEASLERVLFYAIEMVRVDCVESGLISLTSPSIPGLSSVPIPYWLPHDSSTFPNPNHLTKDTWFRLVDVRSVATQTTLRTNQISRWIQTNVSYLNPSWNGCESIHRFGSPGVDSVQSGAIEWSGKGSGRRRPSVSTFRDSIDDDSFPMSIDYRLSSWAADRATQTTSEGELFSEEYFDVDDMDVDSLKSELGSVYGEDSSDEMSSSERQRYEDLIAANEAIETGLMALVAGELALLTAEIANDEINEEANESDSSSVPPCILYKGNDIPWLDDEGWDSDEQRYTCNGKPNSLSIRRDSRSHGSDTSNDCLDNRLSDDDGEKENKSDVHEKLYEKQLVKRTLRSASKRSSSSEGSVSSVGSQTCEQEFEEMPKYLETDLDSVEIIDGKISFTGQQGSSAFTKVKSIKNSNDLVNIDYPLESVNDEYEDKYLLQDSISGYLENEDDEDELIYELGTILNSENAVSNTHSCDKMLEPQITSLVDCLQEDFEESRKESMEKTELKQIVAKNDIIQSSEILGQSVSKEADLVGKYDIQPANESDNEETESQSEYESAYLDDDQEQDFKDDAQVDLDLNEEVEQRNDTIFQYPSYIIAESSVSYIGDSSEDIPPSEDYNWILSQYGSPSVQKSFGVPFIRPESSKNVVNEVDSFDSMTPPEEMEEKQRTESPELFYEEVSSNSDSEKDNQISDQFSALSETPKTFDKFAQEFVSLQKYDENNNLILNEQETANDIQENSSRRQIFEELNSNEESIGRAELNEDLNFEELDAEISQLVSSYDGYDEKGNEKNLVDSDWYNYDQERYEQNQLDFDYEMEADSPSRYRESYLRKQSSEDIEPDYEEYMNEIEMKNETSTYASQVLGAIKDKIATLLNRPVILNDDQVDDDMSDNSSTQLDENNNDIGEHELMEKISPSFEILPKMESKDNLEKKLELELETRKDLINMSNQNYPQTVECLMMNPVEACSSKVVAKSDFIDINREDNEKMRESNIEPVQMSENASEDLSKSLDCASYELQEQIPSKEISNISSESDNEMVKSIDSNSSAIDSGLMLSLNTSIINTESLFVDFNSAQSNVSNFASETDVTGSSLNEFSKFCENDDPEKLRHENTPELDADVNASKLPNVTYDEVVSARKDSSESVTVDGLGPSGSEYDTATTDQSSSSYKTAIPFSSDENSFATIQSSSSMESINSIESDKSIIQTEFIPSLLEMRIENNAENLSNDELYDELPIEVMKESLRHQVDSLDTLAEELTEDLDDVNNEYDELTYLADEMPEDEMIEDEAEAEEANFIFSEADRLKARLLQILNRPTVLPESRLEDDESTDLSDSVSDQVSLSLGIEDEYENELMFSEKDQSETAIETENEALASAIVESCDNLKPSLVDTVSPYNECWIAEGLSTNEMPKSTSDEEQIMNENDSKNEVVDETIAKHDSKSSIDQIGVSKAIESIVSQNEAPVSVMVESNENLKEQISVIDTVSICKETASIADESNDRGARDFSLDQAVVSQSVQSIAPQNEDSVSAMIESSETLMEQTSMIDSVSPCNEIASVSEIAIETENEASTSTLIESWENLRQQASVVDTVSPYNEYSIAESPSTNEMPIPPSDELQIVDENDDKNEAVDGTIAKHENKLSIDQVGVSKAIDAIVSQNEEPVSAMVESNENLKEQIFIIDSVSLCNEKASVSESPCTNEMPISSSDEVQVVNESDYKNESNDRDLSDLLIDQADVSQAIQSIVFQNDDSASKRIESCENMKEKTSMVDNVSPFNDLRSISENPSTNEMTVSSSDGEQVFDANDYKNEAVDESNDRDASALSINQADVRQAIESIVLQNQDSASAMIESCENLKGQISISDAVSSCNEKVSIPESPRTNEIQSPSNDVEPFQSFSEIKQIETFETAQQNEVENVLKVEKAEIDTQQSDLVEVFEALDANVREDLLSSVQEPTIELKKGSIASELDDIDEETMNTKSLKLEAATIEESSVLIDDKLEPNRGANAEVSEIDYLPKAVTSSKVVQEKNENESLDVLKASCINDQTVDEKVSENEMEKLKETDKEKDDTSSESKFSVLLELEPKISEPFHPDSELEQSINFETIAQPNLISEYKNCPTDVMSETIELSDIATNESNLEFIQVVASEQQKVDEIQDYAEKCEKRTTIEDSLPTIAPSDELIDANSLNNNVKENESIDISSTERESEKLSCQTYDQTEKSQNESIKIEKDAEDTSNTTFENESESKTVPKMDLKEEKVASSGDRFQQLNSESVISTSSQMLPCEVSIFKLQEVESEEPIVKDSGDQVLLVQEDQLKPLEMSEKTELIEPQNPIKVECHLENFEETIEKNIDSVVDSKSESIFSTELSQSDEMTTFNVGKELNFVESNLSPSLDSDKSTLVQTNEPQNLKKDEKQSDLAAISSDIVNMPEEMNLMDEKKVNEAVPEQSVDKPKKPERKKKVTKPKIEIAQSSEREELLSPILDADHEAEVIENTFKDEIMRDQTQSMKSEKEVKEEFESQPIESVFIEKTEMDAKIRNAKTDADEEPNNKDLSLRTDEKSDSKTVDISRISLKDSAKASEKQIDDSNTVEVEKLQGSIEVIKGLKVDPFVNAESETAFETENPTSVSTLIESCENLRQQASVVDTESPFNKCTIAQSLNTSAMPILASDEVQIVDKNDNKYEVVDETIADWHENKPSIDQVGVIKTIESIVPQNEEPVYAMVESSENLKEQISVIDNVGICKETPSISDESNDRDASDLSLDQAVVSQSVQSIVLQNEDSVSAMIESSENFKEQISIMDSVSSCNEKASLSESPCTNEMPITSSDEVQVVDENDYKNESNDRGLTDLLIDQDAFSESIVFQTDDSASKMIESCENLKEKTSMVDTVSPCNELSSISESQSTNEMTVSSTDGEQVFVANDNENEAVDESNDRDASDSSIDQADVRQAIESCVLQKEDSSSKMIENCENLKEQISIIDAVSSCNEKVSIKTPKVEVFVKAESEIANAANNETVNEEKVSNDDSEVEIVSKQRLLEASKLIEDPKVNKKKDSVTKSKESIEKITLNNESINTLASVLFEDVELRPSDINETKTIDASEIIESNLAKPSQIKVTFVESRVKSDLFEQPTETTEKLTIDNSEKSVLDKVEVQRSNLIDSVNIEIQPTILIKDQIKTEEAKLLVDESPSEEITDSQVDSCAANLVSLEPQKNIDENEMQVNSAYQEIAKNEIDVDLAANAKAKASLHEQLEEPSAQLNEVPLICTKEKKVLTENKALVNCVDSLQLESTGELASFKPNTDFGFSSTQQKCDLYNCTSGSIDVRQCPKKVELENADEVKEQLDEPFDDSSKVVHQNKPNEKVEVVEPESKKKSKPKKNENGEKVSKLDKPENKSNQNTTTSSNAEHANKIESGESEPKVESKSNQNNATSSNGSTQPKNKIESDKSESKVESKSNKLESSGSIEKGKDGKGAIRDKSGKVEESKLEVEKCSNLDGSIEETAVNKSSVVKKDDVVEGKRLEKSPEKADKLSVKRKSLLAKPEFDKLVSVQLEIPFIGGALTWKMPVSVPSDKRRKSSSLKKEEDREELNSVIVKRKSSKESTNNGDVDTVFNLDTKSKPSKQETEASTEATIKTKVDHQVDSLLKPGPTIEATVNIVANTEKVQNKSQSESEKNNTLKESITSKVDKTIANQPSIKPSDKLKSPSPPSSPVSLSAIKTEEKSKSKRKVATKKEVDYNGNENGQMKPSEVDTSVIKSPVSTIRDTSKDVAFESRITEKTVDHSMQFSREPLVTSTPRVEQNQPENISNRSRRDMIPPMSPNRRERSSTRSVRRSLSRSRDRPNIPIVSKGYNQMSESVTSIEPKSSSIRSTYSGKSNESLRLFAESRMTEDRLSRFDSYKLHLPSSRSYLRRSYESLNDIYHRTIDAVEDDYLRVKRTYNSIDSTNNQFNSYNRLNDEMKYKSNYSTRFNDYHSYIDHNRLVKSLDYSSHRRKKITSTHDYRRRQFNSDYSISTDYSSLFNSIRDRINQLKSDSRKRFRQIEHDYIYHSCPDITLLSSQSIKRPSSSLSHKVRRRQSPEKLVSHSLEVNRYRSRPSNESNYIRRTTSSFNINGQSERVKTSGSSRNNFECKLSNYTPYYTSVQDLNYYTRRVETKAQSDKSKIYTDYLGPWFSNNSISNLSNYRPSRLTYSQIDQPIRRRESSSPPSFSSDYCFKSKLNFDDYHSSRNLIYGNEDIHFRQSNKSSSVASKREVSIKYYDTNERLNNLTVSRSFLDLNTSSSHLSNDLEYKLVRARSNWARTQSTIKASNHDKPLKSFSSNESQTLKKFIRK